MSKTKQKVKKKNLWISISVFIILLPIFIVVFSFYGPFDTVRRIWICTAMSTANHKYLATAFFSEETIEKYTSQYFDTIDDLPKQDFSAINTDKFGGEITSEKVNIGLSRGVLLKIPDPSRIDIAVCDYIGNSGMTLDHLIKQEGAVAGINAGAYANKDGSAHGSVPDGAVVKDGKIVENEPKGKSIRRAICDRIGEIFMVETGTKESFHDFAQALVDLGVDQAIYLVGSSAYGWAIDETGTTHEFGNDAYYTKNIRMPQNISYIVWKRK